MPNIHLEKSGDLFCLGSVNLALHCKSSGHAYITRVCACVRACACEDTITPRVMYSV